MDITGKFYYSRKAASLPGIPVNKCLLANGYIEQYTEWVNDGGEPGSKWDDLVYLGEGIIYWHNGVDQVTPAEVYQWQMRRRIAWAFRNIAWLAICFVVVACAMLIYAYAKGMI